MKKIFFSFFLPFLPVILFACKKQPKDVEDPGWKQPELVDNRITIMSYNVRYCTPYLVTPVAPDVSAIAAVINREVPDVVFLQEVDRNTTRSKKTDQLSELSKMTDMPFTYYGKAIDYQGGEFGVAFLSRYLLSDEVKTALPGADENRVLIQANIKVNDKTITIACTHLDLYQENRDAEVPVVNSRLSATPYPVIFGGDLNATPINTTIQTLLGYGFSKITPTSAEYFTIPSDKPNRQLDYIMCRPAEKFKTISTKVATDARVSDHLPVVAVIELQ
ncbi:MAG: endonuclease/exonuclease/phosphatase family protein [Bacteroidales bacterium]|jgi:endonuclease/exonuclease/phosphatase family metal-dependent hydrolase|nr:endonuclease/exonuclease/phosphatase family protein [Bacteroidales bacterium]